jgi:hypothetical protein
LTVLSTAFRWLACFAAGPVVLAVMGYFYWLHCGEPSIVDWLILGELSIIGVAYQIFALIAVTDRGRLLDLNPLTVADIAHRMGWRGLIVVFLAVVAFLAHGWLLLLGIAEVHLVTIQGWLMLTGGWVSAIFWSTFFCRLLGVWCFRTRQAVDTEARASGSGEARA